MWIIKDRKAKMSPRFDFKGPTRVAKRHLAENLRMNTQTPEFLRQRSKTGTEKISRPIYGFTCTEKCMIVIWVARSGLVKDIVSLRGQYNRWNSVESGIQQYTILKTY